MLFSLLTISLSVLTQKDNHPPNSAHFLLFPYRYDAFGKSIGETGTTDNKYLFAGEQFDQGLGNYYLRQRYYDTSTGRFARRDTYEAGTGDLNNANKYIYASNNPLTLTDPTGLFVSSTQEFTVTQKMRTDLEASYRLPAAIRTYQMTRTSKLAIAAAVATATALGGIMTVSTARSLNRLLGVPIVFWGNDVNEVTEHQFKAVTGSGYTINNTSGAIGRSIPISPALHRGDARLPDRWRYKHPQSIGKSRSSQVDEFPYASTVEGGEDNYKVGLVSLHQVNGSQNGSNGKRLQLFWDNPTVNVTKYGTNRLHSLFLNVPVPGLGGSFGLDRQGNIVSI